MINYDIILEMESSIFWENNEKNIMLREQLSEFNEKQWEEIRLHGSSTFHQIQHEIYQQLMWDAEKFEKYFHSFYANHVQLYEWYRHTYKTHPRMLKYVFRKLLSKQIENYEEQFTYLQFVKNQGRITKKEFQLSVKKNVLKETIDQLTQKILSETKIVNKKNIEGNKKRASKTLHMASYRGIMEQENRKKPVQL